MPKVVFIRHAESAANAGEVTENFASIPLTSRGEEQARELVTQWSESPALIVVSPFTRARDTARFTTERFPEAPVEEWPVQEFTFLRPSRWNGTSWKDRWAAADEYWKREDPEYSDGPDTESFAGLLRRVEASLERLRTRPEPLVFVFTHCQVMHAIRVVLENPGASDAQLRALFLEQSEQRPIANCERITVDLG